MKIKEIGNRIKYLKFEKRISDAKYAAMADRFIELGTTILY